MKDFTDWYVWLTSHRKAGKELLVHFAQDFIAVNTELPEDLRRKVTLRIDKLQYTSEDAALWIKALLTREMCERILVDLGWSHVDKVYLGEPATLLVGKDLIENNVDGCFEGDSRWEAALQWALERWEKDQP